MKKFILLIFGVLVAMPAALCQLDTIKTSKISGRFYWMPEGLKPIELFSPDDTYALIHLRLNNVVDVRLAAGMQVVYVPESNIDSLNKVGKTIRSLMVQVPDDAVITNAQKTQLEQLVNSFLTNAPPPVIITENIDNLDEKNIYTGGGWRHPATILDHFNKSISWSCTTGESLTTTFEGSEISWYAEKLFTHGKIGVSIDDGDETIVDLYSAERLVKQKVFTRTNLSNGPHTIKLRVTGDRNEKAVAWCVVHDYFEVKKIE